MQKNTLVAVAAAATLLVGCAGGGLPAAGPTYTAQLQPLNSGVTGSEASGQATFVEDGDRLTIRIRVEGVPANIEHWQHFHGFADGAPATCATAAADSNGDGIVDLIETEPLSGTTMVPFIAHPATMDIPHGTYPVADAGGSYQYEVTVSRAELQAGFAKQFPNQRLDLDKRVVYIHGVPADAPLPSSVSSLGPIPASTTLPIACGVITRGAGK